MTHKKTVLTLALGSAIAAAMGASSAGANESPFAAQPLAKGYMVAATDTTEAKPAAKAAEGSCGDMKGAKAAEGACGDMKKDDKAAGKSGDAKCGGMMKKKEGKCGGMKKMEGKCGGTMKKKMEGKCGDMKSSSDAKPAAAQDAAKAKDASCGASMKSGDGKTSEGSCGASMKSDAKK